MNNISRYLHAIGGLANIPDYSGKFSEDGRYLGVPSRKCTLGRNKNLKEFHINGKTVWAINEKNAIRKAKKL